MPSAQPVDRVANLIAAADRVWNAYLDYGPVQDGRAEGKQFDDALTALMIAATEVRVRHRPITHWARTRLSDGDKKTKEKT